MSAQHEGASAPRRRSSLSRRLSVLLAGLLTALLLGTPSTVAAHTELLSSTPQDGARLSGPISQVRLTFSSAITPAFAKVALTVDGGNPRSLTTEVDGRTVSALLPDGPGATGGQQHWEVAYRVVSVDGHPVNGRLAFTMDAPAASQQESPRPAPTAAARTGAAAPTAESSPAPVTPSGEAGGRRWLVPGLIALLLLIIGIASFWGPRLVERPSPSPPDGTAGEGDPAPADRNETG